MKKLLMVLLFSPAITFASLSVSMSPGAVVTLDERAAELLPGGRAELERMRDEIIGPDACLDAGVMFIGFGTRANPLIYLGEPPLAFPQNYAVTDYPWENLTADFTLRFDETQVTLEMNNQTVLTYEGIELEDTDVLYVQIENNSKGSLLTLSNLLYNRLSLDAPEPGFGSTTLAYPVFGDSGVISGTIDLQGDFIGGEIGSFIQIRWGKDECGLLAESEKQVAVDTFTKWGKVTGIVIIVLYGASVLASRGKKGRNK